MLLEPFLKKAQDFDESQNTLLTTYDDFVCTLSSETETVQYVLDSLALEDSRMLG